MRELNKMMYFGSMIGSLREGSFRCVSANMSNLPVNPDDPKTTEFVAFLKKYNVGMFLGQEVGLNERVLPEEARLNGRLQPCFA